MAAATEPKGERLAAPTRLTPTLTLPFGSLLIVSSTVRNEAVGAPEEEGNDSGGAAPRDRHDNDEDEDEDDEVAASAAPRDAHRPRAACPPRALNRQSACTHKDSRTRRARCV